MNAQEIADFINNEVAWEPGITVRALPRSAMAFAFGSYDDLYGSNGEVDITITANSLDSSSIQPDGKYPELGMTVQVAITLTVGALDRHMTREQILYLVIRKITELHEHETREYTRVKDDAGRWPAPFHPHNTDGDMLWFLRGNKEYSK